MTLINFSFGCAMLDRSESFCKGESQIVCWFCACERVSGHTHNPKSESERRKIIVTTRTMCKDEYIRPALTGSTST